MNETSMRFAGWAAYVNFILSVANTLTLITFFIIGGFWGPLNDSLSVFWALSFIPLLLVFYQLHKTLNKTLALSATIIGVVSMLVFAFLQTLLLMRIVRFEETFLSVVTLGAILGLAWVIFGQLVRSSQTLPVGLSWLMMAFGLGFLLSALGLWLGDWDSPLAAIGYVVGALTGPIWTFKLGRLWSGNPISVQAG